MGFRHPGPALSFPVDLNRWESTQNIIRKSQGSNGLIVFAFLFWCHGGFYHFPDLNFGHIRYIHMLELRLQEFVTSLPTYVMI